MEESQSVSKNQLKRLKKKQIWEENKEKYMEQKKQKRKEARQRKRELYSDSTIPRIVTCQPHVIKTNHDIFIDLDFESYMLEKGKIKDAFNKISPGYMNWDKDVVDVCESANLSDLSSKKLVYLTADSPNILETLSEEHAYIIGGIVDRNRYKSLCFDKAERLGIAHGRLPIKENVPNISRHILTVNQVVEILLNFIETDNWIETFKKTIPARKMGTIELVHE